MTGSRWLTVLLPHLSGEYGLVAGLSSGEGTISYGVDHIHIASDPENSFLEWPPDANDDIDAMVGYLRWFLEGAVEVDVRHRWTGTTTTTVLLGEAEPRMLQNRWVAYCKRPSRSRNVRYDYTRAH